MNKVLDNAISEQGLTSECSEELIKIINEETSLLGIAEKSYSLGKTENPYSTMSHFDAIFAGLAKANDPSLNKVVLHLIDGFSQGKTQNVQIKS